MTRVPAAYAPHAAFAAPARASAQLGRVVLGLVLVELLFDAGIWAFDGLLGRLAPDLAEALFFGDTALGLVVQLASYGLLAAAVWLVAWRLHDRGFASLIGPVGDVRRMLPAAFAASGAVFMAIQLLPPWLDFRAAESARDMGGWLVALPFALAALLVQTGAEEVLYRGYVQQQLAARFRAPLVWMVVPNLLFAAVHWQDGALPIDNWQYVIWAFCFGLAASDLTARSGNLGPAIGFHLANNAYAFLCFGEAGGPDSGLALFLFPASSGLPDPIVTDAPLISLQLGIELATIGLAWLAVRIAIRR